MSNLPWIEIYLLSHATLLLIICLPTLSPISNTNYNLNSKIANWTW